MLSTLVRRQIEADKRRGFTVSFKTEEERVDLLLRDTVGLMGEVGEFANLLKKIELSKSSPNYIGHSFNQNKSALSEELIDTMIYIFRLSDILDIDLEAYILTKMDKNDERYRHLEK